MLSHTYLLAYTTRSSQDYLRRLAEGSGNVDPQGNFSIEVLRAALRSRYSLDLPNVRQENVLDGIDVTDVEGFVCNKDAHWFAIRKINGRFWNLNSMAERPTIISHFKLATEIASFQQSGCEFRVKCNTGCFSTSDCLLWFCSDKFSSIIFVP